MKKNELKKALKPLIKECIKEMLLEEGLLGNVIQEVVSNMPNGPLIAESEIRYKQPKPVSQKINPSPLSEMSDELKSELNESRRKLEEQMSGQLGINVFEGVQALDKAGDPDSSGLSDMNPLGDPNDPGVDISGIMQIAGGKWNKFK
jgi:hypothetical protein